MGQKTKRKQLKHDGKLSIATSRNRTHKTWKNQTPHWSQLLDKLRKPTETSETPAQYKKMSKAEKAEKKDVGGFVGGALKGGKRKRGHVEKRSLITLDADSTTSDLWDQVCDEFSNAAAVYSTHSHTEKAPRYRLLFPLKRPVSEEEYEPLARKVADMIGMNNFDPTTFQPTRMFFYPSHSRGGSYFTRFQDLPWLDPDEILESYPDWQDMSYWPESQREGEILKRRADKAEDPLEKEDLIGAFCRTYGIQAAIEKFLSEVYEPGSHEDRYTFTGGSTANGLVIYDDKFAYSHHSTDPAGDRLCNAFDLVRLHKFGHLDEDKRENTPIGKLPSYKKMLEFAGKDDETKTEYISQIFDDVGDSCDSDDWLESDDWDDDADDDADDWLETPAEKTDKKWVAKLRISKSGVIESSSHNGRMFLEHSPELSGCLVYNEFTHRKELVGNVPWEKIKKTRDWTDNDMLMLRGYLDTTFNVEFYERTLNVSVLESAKKRPYHPIKDFVERESWDGVKRLESLFIDYLGAEDSDYVRAVTRKWLIGAVARIYQPGCKFDLMPVLSGPQGLGKSTLVRKLAPEFFDDSLAGMGRSKDDLQQLQGAWIFEVSELSAMRATEIENVKRFVSAVEDRFRASYGRETQSYPRSCVFIGTSNSDQYLKDKTGNRRFYPIECDKDLQERTPWDGSLDEIVPQIWAEAKHYFDKGEKLKLSHELEAVAFEKQGDAMIEDLAAETVAEYLDIPLPADWYERTRGDRRVYIQNALIQGAVESGDFWEMDLVFREVVTTKEVLYEAFARDISHGLDGRSTPEVKKIGLIMNAMPGWKRQSIRIPGDKKKVSQGYRRTREPAKSYQSRMKKK